MPRIYLSPSTQEYNPYVTGNGSEEYFMNLVADAMEPYLLANSQYINGVISYMDVLDAQRKYLASQLELSEARTKENLSVVNLYKALGGGWKDF